MKKFLVCSLFCLFLVSCENESPNDPYSPNNQQRDYCNVTFVNATSNYAVKIFIDGENIDIYENPLWKGKKWKRRFTDLSFSKYVKFELHKIADEDSYYTAISATYSESIKFDYTRDYQFTIEDEGIRRESVYAD